MRKDVLWVVVLGILTMGLVAGPDLWAAPGQSPAQQGTVPTRTPTASPPTETPIPPTETPTPPPTTKPKPTPAPLATSPAIPAGGSSEPLLPKAGGWSIHLRLALALMMLGLLVLAIGRWRTRRTGLLQNRTPPFE
jgi:hypothetical protein